MKNVKFELVQLVAPNGRQIRKATRVTFPDGEVVQLMDRLPRAAALKAAIAVLGERHGCMTHPLQERA